MTGRFEEIRLDGVRTVPLDERGSTVSVEDFGTPVKGGKALRRWLDALPDQLAVRRLRALTAAIGSVVINSIRMIFITDIGPDSTGPRPRQGGIQNPHRSVIRLHHLRA